MQFHAYATSKLWNKSHGWINPWNTKISLPLATVLVLCSKRDDHAMSWISANCFAARCADTTSLLPPQSKRDALCGLSILLPLLCLTLYSQQWNGDRLPSNIDAPNGSNVIDLNGSKQSSADANRSCIIFSCSIVVPLFCHYLWRSHNGGCKLYPRSSERNADGGQL